MTFHIVESAVYAVDAETPEAALKAFLDAGSLERDAVMFQRVEERTVEGEVAGEMVCYYDYELEAGNSTGENDEPIEATK